MKVFFIMAIFLSPVVFCQGQTLQSFLTKTDQFFKNEVVDGNLNYSYLAKNQTELDALVNDIAAMKVAGLSSAEKKAFYINAYNILVINQIVNNIDKIKTTESFKGFFDQITSNVGGKRLTLNQLEIGQLLIPYKDPRLHFALACGAKSCPKLANFAYTPQNLEQQLNERAKLTLNDPAYVQLNTEAKTVFLSKIFKWYEKDFLLEAQTLIEYVNKFRDSPIPENWNTDFYEYDWTMNMASS